MLRILSIFQSDAAFELFHITTPIATRMMACVIYSRRLLSTAFSPFVNLLATWSYNRQFILNGWWLLEVRLAAWRQGERRHYIRPVRQKSALRITCLRRSVALKPPCRRSVAVKYPEDLDHMQEGDMNLDGEIVTVRPEFTMDTLQELPNYVGISRDTAGSRGISMNLVVIPAGAKARPHYHEGFETAIYILKGEVQTFYGENLAKSCINKQGDFLYIPAGVPHQPVNRSLVSEAIALVSRTDASEQESVRAYEPAVGPESGA